MWEVIRKNKQKSIIALFVMIVWYSIIYGGICAFFVFALNYDKQSHSFIFNITPASYFLLGIGVAICVFIVTFLINMNKPYQLSDYTMYKVKKSTHPRLYNIVEEIALASGMSIKPSVYVLDSDILNAYACGINPKNSSIVVSKGLLEILERDELQGVVAHEMSHIINRDTTYLLCSGMLYTISTNVTKGLFESAKRGRKGSGGALILALISWIGESICFLLFMFISRKREYLADACASRYTRYPKGLADALLKIKHTISKDYIYNSEDKVNYLVRASFIVPLREDSQDSLKSTHPSTQNRIKVLLNMTTADFKAYEKSFNEINRKSIIPKRTLQSSKTIEIKNTQKEEVPLEVMEACALNTRVNGRSKIIQKNKDILDKNIKKHRQVEDFVRDLAGYSVINCDCGTKLKIPPIYKNTVIICPHCNKKHSFTTA